MSTKHQLSISKPLFNLKDPDLQQIFGVNINADDTNNQRRYKMNKLRNKISEAGIVVQKLGREEVIVVHDLFEKIKPLQLGSYNSVGPNRVQ